MLQAEINEYQLARLILHLFDGSEKYEGSFFIEWSNKLNRLRIKNFDCYTDILIRGKKNDD